MLLKSVPIFHNVYPNALVRFFLVNIKLPNFFSSFCLTKIAVAKFGTLCARFSANGRGTILIKYSTDID